MPAPSSAYLNKNINTISASGQQVANNRAIITDEKEVLKYRFWLDELLLTKDADGNDGFTGLVVEGSFAHSMHSTARIGSLRTNINSATHLNFTDAGLHTKGTCSIGVPYSEFGEGVKVLINWRTAFYVPGDGLKLRYRINGGNWNEYFVSGVLPQNETGSLLAGLNDAGGIQPSSLVDVQALHVNAEGTYTSNTTSFVVPQPSTIMAYGSYASNAYSNYISNNGRMLLYFSTFDLEIGSEVYTNQFGNINAAAGFYSNDSFWIKVEMVGDAWNQKAVITSAGSVGTWGSDDPATPAQTYPVTFMGIAILGMSGGRTWQQVCSNPAYLQEYNCHVVASNQRYVTAASQSAEPIANAIYYTSETEFVVIQNGYITNYGNCNDGIIIEDL